MDSYTLFNIFEGIFWIGMGVQAWVLSKMLSREYFKLSLFAAGALIMFGMSDFLEIILNGLFSVWLIIIWKFLCILGLAIVLIWYIKLRLKSLPFLDRQTTPDAVAPTLEQASADLFQCPACRMRYKDKKWADQCFAWCKTYHSCNLEIIEHAVK
jgi:hypothetical protein